MNKYLYHGIKWGNYDLLIKILESGFILPRCMIEDIDKDDHNNIFNGTKYISLTDKVLLDGERSSYEEVIVDSPCFVLRRDNISLIQPKYVDWDEVSIDEKRKILYSDSDERYSYYGDEVQTKEQRSLKSNLVAIGLPMYDLDFTHDKNAKLRLFGDIKKALSGMDIDVPILNSSLYSFADDDENIEKSKIII